MRENTTGHMLPAKATSFEMISVINGTHAMLLCATFECSIRSAALKSSGHSFPGRALAFPFPVTPSSQDISSSSTSVSTFRLFSAHTALAKDKVRWGKP